MFQKWDNYKEHQQKWCEQLIEAISTLHERNIAHLDIQSDNVLITSENNILIIDFGLSLLKSQWTENKNKDTKLFINKLLIPPSFSSDIDLQKIKQAMNSLPHNIRNLIRVRIEESNIVNYIIGKSIIHTIFKPIL